MPHDLKLFAAYTACTRVTMTALEVTGAAYDLHMIDFHAGANRTPEYLALNPQGKVPCLVIDGQPLTENLAILRWLHAAYPEAKLFPAADSALDEARHLAVLGSLGSVWHPSVRAIKVPFLWTKGDPAGVKARGEEIYRGLLDQLDSELAERRWCFGDEWSIADTYYWWAYINSEFGGFDLSPWQNVARHRADNEALPQLQRALAKERAAHEAMEAAKQ
ncbi:glutathione S-transferase family protein [Aurantiacibacter gilvus]|uniref:Glutathione S-transferase family protein n=1 Tax=Aurantiacibacter gilvus TaxID=3139141 RepID=A0ABU9IF69_9SPHN